MKLTLMSRLRSAVYGERSDLSNKVNRFNESVDEYSLNGSIKHLVRRGKKNDGEYGKIDNLHAYYDGNQLQRVEDNAIKLLYNGSMDFKDSGDSEVEYTYNDNGALTSDKNRGIALIEYDNCNNPKRVQFTNGNVTEYIYTATGQKLRTIHYTAISNITVPMGTTHTLTQNETQSIDSTDYLLAGTYRLTNGMRSMYLFPGGYCNLNDPTVTGTGNPSTDSISYHYYNKDHLGNNREVISENGQVEQIVHYYPFGTPFTDGSSTNIGLQPYLYGNKELDMMHGLNTYDFGARNYNPLLPMWDKVDPKASDYPGLSPYGYCALNPINAIDPFGEDIYMLFYTEDNKRGDDMFKQAAYTRKQDIMNSSSFDPGKDIIIMAGIKDISKIGLLVGNIVDTYSGNFGKTAEFSIWSHSSVDGPSGTIETSQDRLGDGDDRMQMTIDGWSKINFNWNNGAAAYFMGCQTGVSNEKTPSFSTRLSGKFNFKDVKVYGQTDSAYPSIYANVRVTTQDIINEKFSYPIYMVAAGKLGLGKYFPKWTPAYPMRCSVNGKGVVNNYYQPGRKW